MLGITKNNVCVGVCVCVLVCTLGPGVDKCTVCTLA